MFKPGQKIIAVRNHVDKVFLKGQIFQVKATKNAPCGCHSFLVDIGIRDNDSGFIDCNECGYRFKNNSPIHWFSNKNFAPVDYSFADRVLSMIQEEIMQHSELFVEN